MKKRTLTELLKEREEIFAPFSGGKLLISALDQVDFSASVVLMLFDMRNLIIKRISHNCEKIWSWTKHEMEGRNISEFIHPEDLEESLALADVGVGESEPIVNYKNRHFDKQGNVVYLLWQTTATINLETLCFIEKITELQFYE